MLPAARTNSKYSTLPQIFLSMSNVYASICCVLRLSLCGSVYDASIVFASIVCV